MFKNVENPFKINASHIWQPLVSTAPATHDTQCNRIAQGFGHLGQHRQTNIIEAETMRLRGRVLLSKFFEHLAVDRLGDVYLLEIRDEQGQEHFLSSIVSTDCGR